MSRRKKKIVFTTITIKFTVEEKKMLDEIARRDRRDLSEEIFWLIENYHNGKLDDVQKIVVGVERAMQGVIQRGGNPFPSHVQASVPPKTPKSDGEAQSRNRGQA